MAGTIRRGKSKGEKKDPSLSQLIINVSLHPTTPGVCSAIVCLNAKGKSARGDDHISSVVLCGSTDFREKPDGVKVCRKCWTPMQKEQDIERETTQQATEAVQQEGKATDRNCSI